MSWIRLSVASFLLLFVSLAVADEQKLVGNVVSVHDGDTVTVLANNEQHKVRLAGIDAPELDQPFGRVSRSHLSRLIAGKLVRVSWKKTDRFGRLVGVVELDDADVNLKQVEGGFAWHYKTYEKEQTHVQRSLYSEAEERAHAANIGLWTDPEPVPPWEWRRTKR